MLNDARCTDSVEDRVVDSLTIRSPCEKQMLALCNFVFMTSWVALCVVHYVPTNTLGVCLAFLVEVAIFGSFCVTTEYVH